MVAIDYETEWDVNLRGNLRLWPEPVPNIAALAASHGDPYDEAALLRKFPSTEGKSPSDTRAVRNTFEILAYSGLMYRETVAGADRLLLTDLGECLFSFLGTTGGTRFANDANRPLPAELVIRSLSLIVEVRAVWLTMLRVGGSLSNEELNRAMAAISRLRDVDEVGERIVESRRKEDPTVIGERIYEPGKFGTDAENDQRKAMNPHFLLAGGGGLFIDLGTEMRRLEPTAVAAIERAFEETPELLHSSTNRDIVKSMSKYAGVPTRVDVA